MHQPSPFFSTQTEDGLARTGTLLLKRGHHRLNPVQTPALFPVTNLMTGTTTRGGGIWRFLLDHFLAEGRPLMTQALQFLDFSLPPAAVERWLAPGEGSVLAQHVAARGLTDHRGALFLDSGGYKFLVGKHPDLSRWGIRPDGSAWRRILALQEGLGGDALFSLDYPLRRETGQAEATDRITRTRENSLMLLRHLAGRGRRTPTYLPVHGRTPEELAAAIKMLLQAIAAEGLIGGGNPPIGIALGSLVPLRVGNRQTAICAMLAAAREAVPENLRSKLPIHLLGVGGTLIPVLTFLGADTYDSSSYVQNARTLDYYNPSRRVRIPILEWEEAKLPCSCPSCQEESPAEWQAILAGKREGELKSRIYARIALHNLYWEDQLTQETRQAIQAGSLEEHLVSHAKRFPSIRTAVEAIASNGRPGMRAALSRQHFALRLREQLGDEARLPPGQIDLMVYSPGPPPWIRISEPIELGGCRGEPFAQFRPPALTYGPDAFRLPDDWEPEPEKDVLLVIPCSLVKPYGGSSTHRAVLRHLEERLASLGRVQKVTLSGLYGPVPEPFETDPNVLGYDYRLTTADQAQVQLCASRLAAFLTAHRGRFPLRFGYATARAYREAMRRATFSDPGFRLLPDPLGRQKLSEFFRHEHLEQLSSLLLEGLLILESEPQTVEAMKNVRC